MPPTSTAPRTPATGMECRKSVVREEFQPHGPTGAKFKACFNSVKKKHSNTMNLWGHLNLKNFNYFKKLEQEQREERKKKTGLKRCSSQDGNEGHTRTRLITIEDCSSGQTQYDNSHVKQKKFDQAVMNFFIKDLQSFLVVEGSGLREMIQVADPRLLVKHRTTFLRKKLPLLYKKVKERLYAALEVNIVLMPFLL